MAVTLAELMGQVAGRRLYVAGTTTSAGTTTTLVCSALVGRGQIVPGVWVTIGGVTRQVTNFSSGTGTVTFTPAAGSAVGNGVAFVLSAWHWEEVRAAVQHAVRAMGRDWLVSKSSTAIVLDWKTQDYALPIDCVQPQVLYVNQTAKAQGNGVPNYVPMMDWDVRNVAGALTLTLRDGYMRPYELSHETRLNYLALVTVPIADGDVLNLGDNDERTALAFLRAAALQELYMSAITNMPESPSAGRWLALANKERDEAERIRQTRKRPQGDSYVRGRGIARQI